MKLTAREIAAAVGGSVIAGSPETIIENITTDSHKMKGNDLFIPIKGARVDGHKFIADVASTEAAATFTAYDPEVLKEMTGEIPADFVLIRVNDTREALQGLGAYYRSEYVQIPYVGVTGSVGKTTTREMITCALSAGKKVYSTKGNANSQTGVPITVTETEADAEIGVIEMGISEFGEMSRISGVVQCDMAVVTIIGVSHIGNLGSQENIMREKLHICESMKENGILLLNGDDPLLSRADIRTFLPENAAEKNIRIVYYGTGDNAFFRAVNVQENDGCAAYELLIDGQKAANVSLSVPGTHMLLNSLAALACAYYNGVEIAAAAKALEAFSSLDGRGRIFESKGIKVINDAYNAAPQSMMAGIKVLNGLKAEGKRAAVLADMLELGPDEVKYHREVGEYIASDAPNVDLVFVYGTLAKHIAEGAATSRAKILCFDTIDSLKEAVIKEIKAGDAVLFKGSNSMKLGKLVEELYS